MQVELLKSKIHRAELTGLELNYEGSMSIDKDILDQAGILPYEKILIVNQSNGSRIETYAIEGARGSREFCLNGAAARCGLPGDLVTIMAFATMTPEEAKHWTPTVVLMSNHNKNADTK
ncbi:MAG: aspartate 1-decarboxylase [Lentisphaerae bacterium]|jgi:aspartate 1-decarboxylase|nr:aspartate 1-decarboxylase [Lentisphaerota bacterium]